MKDGTTDIERIVRDVIAQMETTRPQQPLPTATTDSAAEATPAALPSSGQLELTGRVVTLGQLQDRLGGIRTVVVPQGAVVTPAARDELRLRKITLQMGGGHAATAGVSAVSRLVLFAAATSYDPEPLGRLLDAEPFSVEIHRSNCLIETVNQLATEVASAGVLGVIVTSYSAAAVCLANRQQGLRGVCATSVSHMEHDAAEVGANVLVIPNERVGLYPMKQLISRFGRGGVRPCPTSLEKQLA